MYPKLHHRHVGKSLLTRVDAAISGEETYSKDILPCVKAYIFFLELQAPCSSAQTSVRCSPSTSIRVLNGAGYKNMCAWVPSFITSYATCTIFVLSACVHNSYWKLGLPYSSHVQYGRSVDNKSTLLSSFCPFRKVWSADIFMRQYYRWKVLQHSIFCYRPVHLCWYQSSTLVQWVVPHLRLYRYV